MRASLLRLTLGALLVGAAVAVAGCKSKVTSVRDALIEDDPDAIAHVTSVPACTDATCLQALAQALGSPKGFDSNDPDQASAAAVALVVARDHRGELVPDELHWTTALREARGPGADALRLAVATEMAALAARVGKPWRDEADARSVMHDAAEVLPGACDAYVLLAAGKAADDSKCVARDLERPSAIAPRRRGGVWRAAAGLQALWKDEAAALRDGTKNVQDPARAALEQRLAVIEAATAKMGIGASP
jgi:hypothetical protein